MTASAPESVACSLAFAPAMISGRWVLTNSQRSLSDMSDASAKPTKAPIASCVTEMARSLPSIHSVDQRLGPA